MSTAIIEPKDELHHRVAPVEIHHSEVLVNADLMNDAVHGENREHAMGMWEACKSYPWACFWASTMSFTIVSPFSRIPESHTMEIRPPLARTTADAHQSGHGVVRYVFER
jgi:hypothetical protein